MKRIGGLFPAIHDFHNLYKAYRRARQGKRHRGPVGRFEENLERELLTLRNELRLDRWRPGPFTSFTIHDPKTRLIEAAPFRDRVVHQAVMGVLEPWFESWFDFDSYACRKGRGLDLALYRARELSRPSVWVLKTDIRKCFQSIDQEVLLSLVKRRFKDRELLSLLERIVRHGGESGKGKGLPIGSLTSQWLANLYLDRMDRYIRQELRPRGYIRYMDDFALFAPDKERLKEMRRKPIAAKSGWIHDFPSSRNSCMTTARNRASFRGRLPKASSFRGILLRSLSLPQVFMI